MDRIIGAIEFLIRAVQLGAGSYATLKLSIYAIGYMRKNAQKREEAKEAMTSVGIGFIITIVAQAIIQWIQGI